MLAMNREARPARYFDLGPFPTSVDARFRQVPRRRPVRQWLNGFRSPKVRHSGPQGPAPSPKSKYRVAG